MKIRKNIIRISTLALFLSLLLGCTSPEEEAKNRQAKGVELFDKGEFGKAELELKSAIQQDKESADSYYYLALLNEKSRNYKVMKENLIQAVKLSPGKIDARLKLGKVQLFFNEKEDALNQVEEILKIDPANEDALILKAAVLVRDKKITEALPIIESVLRANPKHVDALSLKAVLLMEDQNFDQALSLLEPALEQDEENLALHLLKIKIDAKNKDVDAIISDYEKMVQVYPKNDDLKYALAKIYVLAKKNEKAEKLLLDLVDHKPGQIKPKLALLSYYNTVDKGKVDKSWKKLVNDSGKKSEQLFALVKWALSVGKTNEATSVLEELSQSENFNQDIKLEARLLLAKMKFQAKDFEQTMKEVEAILKDNPNLNDAKILKARVLVAEEKLDEAIALLNTVLWDAPNSDEAIVLIGNIYLLQGELDKAGKNFKQALEINPGNLQALFPVVEKAIRDRQFDYAEELLQKALVISRYNLLVLNKLIQIKMAKKDWAGAEELINTLEKQPNAHELAQFLLGKIYQEQGDCNQAVDKFKSILEKFPRHSDSLQELARCYEMLKQRPKMMKYLDDLLDKSPDNLEGIVLKSKLLTLDKKTDAAVSLLEKSVGERSSVSLFSELARVYLVNNNAKRAIEIYNEGLKRFPDNLELSMLLASAYINENKYDEAVKIYTSVLEKNPRLDIARNNLASLLLDQYGAESDIQKAIKLVERFKKYDQPYFLDTYAWAQFKSGRINDALTVLQKVIVSSPTVPVFRYHLARVYQATGNITEAVSELRRSIELAETTSFDQLNEASKLLKELSKN